MEYIAFGEVLFEEHWSLFSSPYLRLNNNQLYGNNIYENYDEYKIYANSVFYVSNL